MSGERSTGHDTFDASGPTLADEQAAERAKQPSALPPPVSVAGTTLRQAEFARRYEFRSGLGQGGMGEVGLYRDGHVGRDVAVKTLQGKFGHDPLAVARFLREARVQGQLEHPSIVPVHDVDVAADGSPFFTMKRVRGTTLEAVLDEARAKGAIQAPFSLRKLLAAFVSVCLAVDFAHRRRVLHRDLKPANVMLGDFGEVYVLDWGIAKVAGDSDEPLSEDLEATGERPPVVPTADDVKTRAGTLLGTPGYMSPEQIRGEPLTARSDVYALGAILFEILALEPMHRGAAPAIAVSTLKAAHDKPSERAPEGVGVPPELEAICEKATALDPDERYESVRELADAVERYLEGDRDVERRRTLATEHVEAAQRALDESRGPEDFLRSRTEAMRALGRAIALDPGNVAALGAIVKLLGDTPPVEPPEVAAGIQAAHDRTVRAGTQGAAWLVFVWLAFLPFAYWMGLRDVRAMLVVLVPAAGTSVLALAELRRPTARRSVQVAHMVLTCVAYVAVSRLFGPYVLVPALAAIYAIPVQTHPEAWARRLVIALCCGVVVLPMLLELTGVVSRTTFFGDGVITIRTPGTLREIPTIVFFALAGVGMILTPSFYVARIRVALTEAERRLLMQKWYLERLLPTSVEP
jgi:serine/threonine protein kinase